VTICGPKEKKYKSGRRIVFGLLFIFMAVTLAGVIPGASKTLTARHDWSTSSFALTKFVNATVGKASPPQNGHLSPRGALAFEVALAATGGAGLPGRFNSLRGPEIKSVSLPAEHTQNLSSAAAPMLITEVDTSRAIAFDTATIKAEPFTSTTPLAWSPLGDHQTRISLFAMNIGPAFGDVDPSSITADAVDFAENHYPLTVEHFSELPIYAGLYMLVVRLNENLGSVGDVLVRIQAHGQTSNAARIGIGYVGAGLPDQSAPSPMLDAQVATEEFSASSLPQVAAFELRDSLCESMP
jgi:hypothetical protein